MNFYDVMQNLAIGIVSGIFSSVIVSVVFYVLNEFQKELEKAKDMTHPIYGIIIAGMMDEQKYTVSSDETAEIYLSEITSNFAQFEPWQFKGILKEAMCKISYIISDGKYYTYEEGEIRVYKEMIQELSNDLKKQLDIIEECEKNFAKHFIVRVLKNRVMIVMAILFVAVIIVA